MSNNLSIYILTENVAGGSFLAEHGLSYLIEIDGKKILWDSGHSDVFLKNAKQLGLNIQNDVKKVVLSHGHWDHGDGLLNLSEKELILHPTCFTKRFRKRDHSLVGLSFNEDEAKKHFSLTFTKSPLKITDNLLFLGEIPRKTPFESQTTPFEFSDYSDDFITDDSSLVAISDNKLVIITGCSHSGICNICEYAKQVTGINNIKAVIGGFHLKLQNEQTYKTIEYFKDNHIETLLPSHCTDLPALSLFYKNFNIKQVKTGAIFRF
jgi:7,8-dihydropterin-6-yl-methyl-4-(beta-D-ribofuranosyl)aminobenzene 5'-phosphate synthase